MKDSPQVAALRKKARGEPLTDEENRQLTGSARKAGEPGVAHAQVEAELQSVNVGADDANLSGRMVRSGRSRTGDAYRSTTPGWWLRAVGSFPDGGHRDRNGAERVSAAGRCVRGGAGDRRRRSERRSGTSRLEATSPGQRTATSTGWRLLGGPQQSTVPRAQRKLRARTPAERSPAASAPCDPRARRRDVRGEGRGAMTRSTGSDRPPPFVTGP